MIVIITTGFYGRINEMSIILKWTPISNKCTVNRVRDAYAHLIAGNVK